MFYNLSLYITTVPPPDALLTPTAKSVPHLKP